MRCIICKGSDIEKKKVEEELRIGNDVIFIPLELMVCLQCGERYYDRKTIKFLEETEDKAKKEKLNLSPVGRVLKPSLA